MSTVLHVGKFDLRDVKGLLDVADVALIVSLPTTSGIASGTVGQC